MSRHLADKRKPSQGGRVKHFLRIARENTVTWHRTQGSPAPTRRLVEFLRIARGRAA